MGGFGQPLAMTCGFVRMVPPVLLLLLLLLLRPPLVVLARLPLLGPPVLGQPGPLRAESPQFELL